MTFGLTSSGFNPKRLEDIKGELETLYRQAYGAGIKLDPDTIFGKQIGIQSESLTKLWELLDAVYNSQYPNSANDISLDRVGEFTGITRNRAARSTATLYLAGTIGTNIPQDSLFAVQDAGDQFKTLSAVTLAGNNRSVASLIRTGSTVTAEISNHGFPVGRRIFMNDADQVEYNGLHTIETVPDTDHITYTVTGTPVSPATGTINCDPATAVEVEAVVTGPIAAIAGTLNQIVNNISGLTRAENQTDALVGRNIETDAGFRTRRIEALKGIGGARLEAIRGSLLQLNNVTDAKVFENTSSLTDGEGRPPKSIECLVIGGNDQEILNTVWNRKAAGIELYGTISGTVTDSQGIDHTSKFTRPSTVSIYLELDLTVNTDFPGINEVESRILAYGDSLNIGDDVIVYPYLVSSFSDVPGILDVVVRIGTEPSPTLDDNIIIPPTQLADFDSSRITIFTL